MPRITAALLAILLAATLATADDPLTLAVGADGRLWIAERGRHLAELAITDLAQPRAAIRPATASALAEGWRIAGWGGTTIGLRIAAAGTGLSVTWRSDDPAARLRATLAMPSEAAAGGGWRIGTASGRVGANPPPANPQPAPLHRARAAGAALAAAAGPWIELALPSAADIAVTDRPWPQRAVEVTIDGEGALLELTVASATGMVPAPPASEIAAGANWLPLPYEGGIEAGSACDLSVLSRLDPPAGRHGRVVVAGENFEFAGLPGRAQRFYGINLVSGTQYLAEAETTQLIDRLVRLGYNSVRIHHWDKLLFAGGDGSVPDPARLADLDRLLAQLTRRGLYLFIDLYCSRDATAEALGLPAGEAVGQAGVKMALPVSPAAVAWWRRSVLALLDHVNPHTGVRWGDDPAWVGMCLVNEGTCENWHEAMLTRPGLAALWRTRWNRWLVERHGDRAGVAAAWGTDPGGDPAAGEVALPREIRAGPEVADLLLCYADAEVAMYAQLSRIVRDEGRCLAPLTNTNGWSKRVVNQLPRAAQDFVDDHWYVDHPSAFADRATWKPPFSVQQHEPTLVGARSPRYAATLRLAGKPFTATEINFCSPGRHRAAGGLLSGAIAGLQGWAGVWRYSYAHTREQIFAPARASFFDVATDPLSRASEGIAIALFLRGDLAPAPRRAVFAIPPQAVRRGDRSLTWMGPAWSWAAWVTGVATTVGEPAAAAGTWGGGDDAWAWEPDAAFRRLVAAGAIAAGNPSDPGRMLLASDDGAVRLDGPGGRFLVDTACSGGAWLLPGTAVELPRLGLAVEAVTTAAAVTAISLDGAPLATSRRILVSHLTEQQNSGTRFATPRGEIVLDPGRLPHLVRAGSARIGLRLADPTRAEVWALSQGGRRLARIAATAAADVLRFTADPATGLAAGGPTLHYEVVIP